MRGISMDPHAEIAWGKQGRTEEGVVEKEEEEEEEEEEEVEEEGDEERVGVYRPRLSALYGRNGAALERPR